MGKAFVITLSLILLMIAFVYYRTGYYKDVIITSGEQGPYILVYKVHKGPYHKIAPIIDEVEAYFKKNNLPCPLAFGRYLHDPNLVEHDRLESHGGCLFSMMDEKLDLLLKQTDYKVEPLEKKDYLVATFDGSPSIGPFKVYPKVKSWLNKYNYKQVGPVIEVYQTTGQDEVVTRYLFEYQ
jgi:AraC family transcriptional regulator